MKQIQKIELETMRKLQNLTTKLFKESSDSLFIQLFRYGFSGGIVFLVDFSLLYVLTDFFGIHYLLSTVFSSLAGTSLSYFFNVKWVFNNRRFNRRRNELILFFTISGFGFVMTPLLMWLFTDGLGLHYLISKIIATAVVVCWNFIAKKIILFPQKKKGKVEREK